MIRKMVDRHEMSRLKTRKRVLCITIDSLKIFALDKTFYSIVTKVANFKFGSVTWVKLAELAELPGGPGQNFYQTENREKLTCTQWLYSCYTQCARNEKYSTVSGITTSKTTVSSG